jgi:hypothetical protein
MFFKRPAKESASSPAEAGDVLKSADARSQSEQAVKTDRVEIVRVENLKGRAKSLLARWVVGHLRACLQGHSPATITLTIESDGQVSVQGFSGDMACFTKRAARLAQTLATLGLRVDLEKPMVIAFRVR